MRRVAYNKPITASKGPGTQQCKQSIWASQCAYLALDIIGKMFKNTIPLFETYLLLLLSLTLKLLRSMYFFQISDCLGNFSQCQSKWCTFLDGFMRSFDGFCLLQGTWKLYQMYQNTITRKVVGSPIIIIIGIIVPDGPQCSLYISIAYFSAHWKNMEELHREQLSPRRYQKHTLHLK